MHTNDTPQPTGKLLFVGGKDIIRRFEKSLFVQFGKTGGMQYVSTLRLDQGVTLSLWDKTIEARYHGGDGERFVVECFSSDLLASTAFHNLQAALDRYTRVRRFAGYWKATIKWGFTPLAVAVLALGVNMAATRAMGGTAASTAGAAPMVPLPSNLGTAAVPPIARPAVASPAELARAMADGAKSGKYAVQLSKGSKGTLYVFSDPSCPHCQDLEPELDKLAKDYTIYIFPVTVIGGAASSHRTAKLMCSKPDARAAFWKKIVQGDDLPNAECADGTDAVARNDQMFRAMRFLGTPTIINAAGEQTPDSIPNTADAINQWMSTATTASK
ncbi:DsbC family protein [Burkholderia cenocepacia]|uniref:DsbC family protein n=1 Tax=Burkholderia cenocepacia TaxID=95486 RepID=UPI002AB74ACD|nr:DsbC family protein [Burkholderia cenocepacia]